MGRITASRNMLTPDRALRLDAGQQVHQLPDVRRQEDASPQSVFYDAMDIIDEKIKDVEPIEVFTPGGRERQAGRRSPLEARRRCRLPGADAGEPQPSAVAGHSLDPDGRPREEGPRRRTRSWPTNSWPPTSAKAPPSPSAKTSTAWPTPTRRSPTSPGSLLPVKFNAVRATFALRRFHAPCVSSRFVTGSRSRLHSANYYHGPQARRPSQHRHHRPHRCRQDDGHRADAVLRRRDASHGRRRQGDDRHRLRSRRAGARHHHLRRLRDVPVAAIAPST